MITPQYGYKIDPNNPNAVVRDLSIPVSALISNEQPLNVQQPPTVPPVDIKNIPITSPAPSPAPQSQSNSFISEIENLTGKLLSKEAETQKRTAEKTADYERSLNELNTQIKLHQASALARQEEALKSGETLRYSTGLAGQVARTDAIEAMKLSALAQGMQGNILLATKQATDAVNAEFAQTEKDLATARQNILNNYDTFTPAEKKRADATLLTLNEKDAFVVQKKEERKQSYDIANEAVKNGLTDTKIMTQIQNALPEEALRIAAPFLKNKETGIVAEYNFYAQQEKAAGRTPMSFNDYQTLDVNRKTAASRAPIIKDYELNGRLVREILDPMTGKTISKTDLGKGKKEEKEIDLSGLDINSPTYIQDVMKASIGGKKPNQVETIRPLQKATTVMNQLSELSSLISKTTTDPILGLVRSMNPYDFDARAIQATLQATVPNLARGVYGEVGVLTDADIRNYIKTLPNIKGTEEQNKFVMGMTLRSLQRGFESQLEVLASAGYDVSGFQNVYQRMNNMAQEIEEEMNIVGKPDEDEIRQEFEILQRGGTPQNTNSFKPMSDFFRELKNSLFK